MTVKGLETLLNHVLLNDRAMDVELYERELEELMVELTASLLEDRDDYIFAITANNGHVAMLLIEATGDAHVNEAARTKLRTLWQGSYETNMHRMIPSFARQLFAGDIAINGVKIMRQSATPTRAGGRLYTLDVFIIDGPMTDSFIENNSVVSRTIQIRGGQTLEDLHHAIFEAFDREEEHAYEFQAGGKGPMDPKARRYVLSAGMDNVVGNRKPAGNVRNTTIDSLGLNLDESFGYWFDFGDDWWHQINVVGIEEKKGRGKYPKVTKRVGSSPPQYVDWDEDEE